jgi:hypothetical protein
VARRKSEGKSTFDKGAAGRGLQPQPTYPGPGVLTHDPFLSSTAPTYPALPSPPRAPMDPGQIMARAIQIVQSQFGRGGAEHSTQGVLKQRLVQVLQVPLGLDAMQMDFLLEALVEKRVMFSSDGMRYHI